MLVQRAFTRLEGKTGDMVRMVADEKIGGNSVE